MTTIHRYAGRRIEERRGVAGQIAYTVVTDHLHYFQLVGSDYGTPGPVTLIVGGIQSQVTAASRFGERFDLEYVKNWIDIEDAARRSMTDTKPGQVVCPTCNAQPGEPCTQPSNTRRIPVKWMHLSRHDAVSS